MSSSSDRLYALLGEMFDVPADELSEASSPETIEGWTSLTHLNLVMALQDEFGVAFTPAQAMKLRTAGDIRALLQERGADVPAPA